MKKILFVCALSKELNIVKLKVPLSILSPRER
jgi:hypothetical protein